VTLDNPIYTFSFTTTYTTTLPYMTNGAVNLLADSVVLSVLFLGIALLLRGLRNPKVTQAEMVDSKTEKTAAEESKTEQQQKPQPSEVELKPTKFCRNCGAKIPKDSTFCKECGKNLSANSVG
jgi:hypothetical protein